MALVCAISQEVPERPCVSALSGVVFERRLIEKFIAENGRDPISNQPLSVEQLIDVKCPPVVRPKPPSATSIPALLKALQDEWDAVMLYSFSLRQQLQTARQELANSLYQNDAACRVIARLTKELQAAREALATLKPSAAQPQPASAASRGDAQPHAAERESGSKAAADSAAQAAAAELVEEGMSEEVISKLQEKATRLTAERKKRGRTLPEGLATADAIKNYQVAASHTALHSASQPGITCLDLLRLGGSTSANVAAEPRIVVTGGVDRTACIFDLRRERVLGTLRGHQKKLTHVLFNHSYTQQARGDAASDNIDVDTLPLQVITASADGSARVWSNAQEGKVGDFREQHAFKCHTAPVNAISLHPTGDYLLTCASDGAWTLLDVTRGALLKREASISASGSTSDELTCIEFHPDGLIFATGTQSAVVKIWDLKELKNVADFPGHSGRIESIAFSENGFYLATSAEDATVKLWDLRKLKNFKTLLLPERYAVSQLAFDFSGAFLAVAGRDVRVFETKQFEQVHTFEHHTAPVTSARFGPLASYIVSASLDRSVKLLAAAPH